MDSPSVDVWSSLCTAATDTILFPILWKNLCNFAQRERTITARLRNSSHTIHADVSNREAGSTAAMQIVREI
jgi:hypothetical protein